MTFQKIIIRRRRGVELLKHLGQVYAPTTMRSAIMAEMFADLMHMGLLRIEIQSALDHAANVMELELRGASARSLDQPKGDGT